jgi:hypothetical protein
MRASFSNWMEEVSMDTRAANSRKPSCWLLLDTPPSAGEEASQRTVMLGSGAGPKLRKVCKRRKLVFVTRLWPRLSEPPTARVAQVGSPAKRAS